MSDRLMSAREGAEITATLTAAHARLAAEAARRRHGKPADVAALLDLEAAARHLADAAQSVRVACRMVERATDG